MNDKINKSNFLHKKLKHDLKNPINAMIGYSEYIIEEIESDDFIIHINDINSIYHTCKQININIEKSFHYIEKNNEIEFKDIEKLKYNIRTSLCTVIGLIEIINDKSKDFNLINIEEFNDCINNIYKSCKAMLSIVLNFDDYIKDTFVIDDGSSFKETKDSYDVKHSMINTKEYKGKILIIDDDKINLNLMDKILKKINHKVYVASNGKDALDLLKKIKFDLILLDIIMPDINGIDLLKQIKNNIKYYEIPVIMLSAIDDMSLIVDCIRLGATDYITKPIDKVLLNARINNCLERKEYRDIEKKYIKRIEKEEKKSNDLLLNIMPESIAARLKKGEKNIADKFDEVTVLFADISGFTKYSSDISPKVIVTELNNIFSIFDDLVDKYNVEKIKTIGDNYMIASGIPDKNELHAETIIDLAIEMHQVVEKLENKLSLKIGISSGDVVAGVIGKRKFIYDLWGDTVNVASRMEMYGEDDKIHLSHKTYDLVKDKYKFSKKNKINIKGKGEMETYFLKI